MLANIIVTKFLQGGPVMWPILLVSLIAGLRGGGTRLQFELETAATNIEVMVNGAKLRNGFDTMEIRRVAGEANRG